MSNHRPDRNGARYGHNQDLARTLKERWGVSVPMFRTAKALLHIAVLGFSTYLIEATSVSPTFVMLFAALLITGPEGVEALLVRDGRRDGPENTDRKK